MKNEKKQLLEILKEPDPRLRHGNVDIEPSWFGAKWLVSFAQNMIYTMRSVKGVGIATPQVGMNYNMTIAVVGNVPTVIINPVILSKADETISIEEGCLSCPGKGVRILRPAWIELKYNNINGKENIRLFGQMDAIIVSHELDHLSGKLITDYEEKIDV
jgi:peptide deformylase